ncbi:OsmC family protein [Desulfococcaceae bacterium OttesenSCG-928-F15]|nr:OsmC family protein [Desulfococcaceae bacterium OttesenSCG-928-F15]
MEEFFLRSAGQGRSLALAENPARRIRIDPASFTERENFSPTDLLALAFASCVLASMEALLKKNGFSPMDFEIRVIKEMSPPPRRISALTLEVLQPIVSDEEMRNLLRKAMDLCPVKRSLSEEIRMSLQFLEAEV